VPVESLLPRELKISEARYEDLLSEADERYPKYLGYMKQVIYVSQW